MPADLPPPIAIHAPVPVVKTQSGVSMNQRSITRTVQQQMGSMGGTILIDRFSSPIFLGGKNNHRKKHSNMLHVSKKARKRHKK